MIRVLHKTMAVLALLTLLPASGRAAELIMVDQPGCIWCARFDQQVGAVYPKTEEGRLAPLRRLDIRSKELRDLKLTTAVRYTPTFILIDQDREIGRITGFQSDDTFWGLFGKLIKKLDAPARPRTDPA